MQFWRQVLDVVTLCFWCPLCISDFRRNRCTRNAEMLGIIGKFSSALNPCGSKVFSFIIQKSSRFFSLCFNSYLSMLVSFNCSINVNFECLLELWPGNRNCWSAWSKFRLFTSFRCLLSLKLKAVSDLTVYCLLYNTHSVRYIRNWLLQLSFLHILKVLCVTVLLKVLVACTCVQHRWFNLELQGFE